MAGSSSAPSPAEQEARRQAALAAGGGVAAETNARVEVASAPARAAALAAILAAFVAFLSAIRQRDQGWLQTELSARGPADDVASVIAEETQRADAFAEGVAKRVAGDVQQALAIPDPKLRESAIQSILAREKRFARMRSEAMAARAFAAINRAGVRRDSPQGAFWKLNPDVAEHTAGCLVMGGKFWPWSVLDRVHPPRHPGCPCRLLSYGEAVAAGDMRAGDVPDVADAIKQASGVVMEAAVADALLAELELRDRLVETGLVSVEALSSVPLAVV